MHMQDDERKKSKSCAVRSWPTGLFAIGTLRLADRVEMHTYPGSTLYLTFGPPPDDLRLETLGRPPTSFGPRSYRPTTWDKIHAVSLRESDIKPRPSTGVRLENLPGPVHQRNYLVQPSNFDVRIGRGQTNLMVPFTMTSGLTQPTYRVPTPRVAPFAAPKQLAPLETGLATARQAFGDSARPGYVFGKLADL